MQPFRFAFEELPPSKFQDCLLAIDEFHQRLYLKIVALANFFKMYVREQMLIL